MTQELRTIQNDKEFRRSLPNDNSPAVSSGASIKETIQEEVMRLFTVHQARHKELADLISSISGQEKSERAYEISKIQDALQGLEKRVETQVLSNIDNSCREPLRAGPQDVVSKEEFEIECRRLWEAVSPVAGITREEFEGQVQRLWEAIMHLQATHLEGVKRQIREDTLSNGLGTPGSRASPSASLS